MKIKGHQCKLQAEDDVLSKYICYGLFINTRRKLKKLALISPNHPLTKEMFSSSKGIQLERERHLMHFYFIIHPFR